MAENKIKLFDDDEFYSGDEVKKLGKTVLPDPELLDYYNMLSQRIIFVNDTIDEQLVFYSKQIIDWNKQDKDFAIEDRMPIKIYCSSNGGNLSNVMNFINVIQLSKTPVTTIGMDKCYSAAGLLLMSATGRRYIFSDTTVLIHSGSAGFYDNTDKVIDYSEFTKKQEERVKQYILKNTKITDKMYEKNYRKDLWLFSDEIIEYGIADKIITDLEEIF